MTKLREKFCLFR